MRGCSGRSFWIEVRHSTSGSYSCASAASTGTNVDGTDPHQGRREDSGEYYTYIHDPDNNMIELVYHPLGLEDSKGNTLEIADDPQGVRWAQKPDFVVAAYRDATGHA